MSDEKYTYSPSELIAEDDRMGALVMYDQIFSPVVISNAKKFSLVVRSEPMYTIFLDDRVGVQIMVQVAPKDGGVDHIDLPVVPWIAFSSQLSSPKYMIFSELIVGDEFIVSIEILLQIK